MARRLRRLLALAMLCAFALVGFVGPEANAVTTGWAQVSVRVEAVDVPNPVFPAFDCQQSFRMTVEGGATSIYAAGGGRCLGGADLSPGFCSIGEVDCTDASWAIHGAGCEGGLSGWPTLVPAVSPNDADNTIHKAFTLGAVGPNSAPAGCDPDEACLTLTGSGFADGTAITGCAPLALDVPATEGGCEYGSVSGNEVVKNDTLQAIGGHLWYEYIHYKSTAVELFASQSGGTWLTYVVYETNGSIAGEVPEVAITNPVQWEQLPNTVAGAGNSAVPFEHELNVNAHSGASTFFWHVGLIQDPTLTGIPMVEKDIVGLGMFRLEDWYDPNGAIMWSLPRDDPEANPDFRGVIGVHNEDRCAFYYGEKLWNNDTTTIDTPGGGLDEEIEDDTPPDPEDLPPPDDPEDTDCAGFSGWVQCSILGWLKNIWNAIVSLGGKIAALPGQIAEAVGDALQDWFVPEDGFLDDLFADIEQEWRESAPGAFVTGFSEMSVDWPASGCGGIPVEFSTQGVNVDFSLGAACSGAAASAASTVKLVTGASLVLFGGLACLRAIGSGFGWSPGVGKGGDGA